MKNIYAYCGIRKQSHYKALQSEKLAKAKAPLYIGFIDQVRQMHPGMGLRTIYERYCPEDIGREWIVLWLF